MISDWMQSIRALAQSLRRSLSGLYQRCWCVLVHGEHDWRELHAFDDGEVVRRECRRCQLRELASYRG